MPTREQITNIYLLLAMFVIVSAIGFTSIFVALDYIHLELTKINNSITVYISE